MAASQPVAVRPLSAGMRRQILLGSLLVFAAGVPLFVRTEQTELYFAWTIKPPFLTAAFLGASYWAAFLLGFMSSRERPWARARMAVPGPLLFTILTLLATLIHIDRFHLGSPNLMTRAITWLWLAIYAGVPISMLFLLVGQLRLPGGDPPRTRPVPAGLRLALGLQAVVMVGLGAALFIAPQATAAVWPWTLTPLTARAVAAWLVGLGTIAAQVIWENDMERARLVMITTTALGVLQLIALARYPGDFDWNGPRGWLYLLSLLSILAAGLYGWRAASVIRGAPMTGRA